MATKKIEELRKQQADKIKESEEQTESGEEAPIVKQQRALQEKKTAKKTECPLTREQFDDGASPLKLSIDGSTISADVKKFSSGSFGWFCNDKVTIEVGGVPVKVQCNVNLVIVGSKDAK